MANATELREKRANTFGQLTELMEATKNEPDAFLSGEDRQKFDRISDELDQLDNDIERLERLEALAFRAQQDAAARSKVDRSQLRGVPGQREGHDDGDEDAGARAYREAFASFIASGTLDMDAEQRRTLQTGFTTDKEARAAGIGTGAAGGYLVPPLFRDYMLQRMLYFGPMLDISTVIRTSTGANLQWPTNDDTANTGAILAENTQVTQQDLTLGTASLNAYMYTSKLVLASLQFLQDAANNPEQWLRDRLAERLGRIYNAHFTTGTGTAQPQGIVTGATVGTTGTGSLATTGGVQYANIVDLVESIDPAYADAPESLFMGHQTVRRALRRLVDAQGRPLWETNVQAGTPPLLLGYPFRVNNQMPTIAQNSKSLLFGSVREAYVIRLVTDILTMRLTERYADFLQVGFLAFQRADGLVQNPYAVSVFQTTPTA